MHFVQMEKGADLEEENVALQLQLENIAVQINELQGQTLGAQGDEEEAGVPTEDAAVETAQCLLQLSDHTNLILAAYGVSARFSPSDHKEQNISC